jgi:hypothetical protein
LSKSDACDFLTKWILPVDFGKLDSSMCGKLHRKSFLDLIVQPYFVITNFSGLQTKSFIYWVTVRQLKVDCLYISDALSNEEIEKLILRKCCGKVNSLIFDENCSEKTALNSYLVCLNVTKLDLSNLTHLSEEKMMDLIFQFPNITHLNLKNCVHVQHKIFFHISEIFRDLQYLDLTVGSSKFNDASVKLFLKMSIIFQSISLHTLILPQVKSMTEDTLLLLLSTFPLLTHLEIDNTSDVSEDTYLEILTREPKMTCFCFKFQHFTRSYDKQNSLYKVTTALRGMFQNINIQNEVDYTKLFFEFGLDGKSKNEIDVYFYTNLGVILINTTAKPLNELEIRFNGDFASILVCQEDVGNEIEFYMILRELFSESKILEMITFHCETLTCLSIQNLQTTLKSTFFDQLTIANFPRLKRIEMTNNQLVSDQDIRNLKLRLAGVVTVCEVENPEKP